jgi:hypothetical protein
LPGQSGRGLCVLRTSTGLGWHYLAGTFLDVIRYLVWWLVGGLLAGGSCWYVGANVYENGCAKRRLPESGWRLSCGYDETYVGAVACSRITSPGKKLTGVGRKAGLRTDRLSLNGGSATPTRSREGLTGADALMNRPPTRSAPTGCPRSGFPPWCLLPRRLARIATACGRRASGKESTRAERVAGITAEAPIPARPRSAMGGPRLLHQPGRQRCDSEQG